jgi:hypothetical protein
MFTPETLSFFERLIASVTIQGSDPNFEILCLQVVQAKKELAAAHKLISDAIEEAANQDSNANGNGSPRKVKTDS